MLRNYSVATFNWLVAIAFVSASINNIAIRNESFGLYLAVYPFVILSMVFLPSPFVVIREMKWFDWFAVAFTALVLVSAALHPNSKSVTYVGLYGLTFIFMAILLRNAISVFGWRDFLQRSNAIGCGALSVIAVAEFFSRYIFGINPLLRLPFINPPVAVCGFDIPRSYGLSVEPTYVAWYLITLGVVAIWYVWNRSLAWVVRIAFAVLLVLATVLTWSTSALVACLASAIGVFAYVILFDRSHLLFWWRNIISVGGGWLAILVVVTAVILITIPGLSLVPCLDYVGMKPISQALYGYRDMETQILAQKEVLTSRQSAAEQTGDEIEVARVQSALDATENSLAQIRGEDGAENSMSRYQIWKRDISKAIEKPFLGWGPGYNSSIGTSSSLNFYIAAFLESGIVGAGFLGLFLLSVGIHIVLSNLKGKYIFLFAYMAGLVHMTTQTRFFFPFVWLLLALFWLENKRQAVEPAS